MLRPNILRQIVFVSLIKQTLAQPIDSTSHKYSEEEQTKPTSPKRPLWFRAHLNQVYMYNHLATNTLEAARSILKDEALKANANPYIVDFKNNITRFVEATENSQNFEERLKNMDIFTFATHFYLEEPEKQVSQEQKFILELLRKYKVDELEKEFDKEFLAYIEIFKKQFEEEKNNFSQPILVWFENFKNLNDVEEQLLAFNEYFYLNRSNKASIDPAPKPNRLLVINVHHKYQIIFNNLTTNTLDKAHDILEDEDLAINQKPLILEFKKNLTHFIDKFEKFQIYKDFEEMLKSLDIFSLAFLKEPENQLSPEEKFISDLLKKYNVKKLEKDFKNELANYLETLKKELITEKKFFSPSVLEWFENLENLTDERQQIMALKEYVDLHLVYSSRLKLHYLYYDLTNQALQAARYILEDLYVMGLDKPLILEFKKNLTRFVEQSEKTKDIDERIESLNIFSQATHFYFEEPENQVSDEQKFILYILRNYRVHELEKNVKKELSYYLECFKKQFKAQQKDFDQPILDWFENFKNLTEVDDQIMALNTFWNT